MRLIALEQYTHSGMFLHQTASGSSASRITIHFYLSESCVTCRQIAQKHRTNNQISTDFQIESICTGVLAVANQERVSLCKQMTMWE